MAATDSRSVRSVRFMVDDMPRSELDTVEIPPWVGQRHPRWPQSGFPGGVPGGVGCRSAGCGIG